MAQFITAAGIDVSKGWLDVALWPDDAAVLHIERCEAVVKNGYEGFSLV